MYLLAMLLAIGVVAAVEVNSTTLIYSFNITGIDANESTVGCEAAYIRFSADIEPLAYVNYVEFRIESNTYPASNNGTYFWYDYYKPPQSSDVNTTIDWDRITIHDVGGGTAVHDPDEHVTNDCDACDYTIITGNCTIYDNQTIQYIGDGSPGCSSYNDTVSCDYCAEDIEEIIITPCDGVQKTVNYTDNNQASCCDITSLVTDCSILYLPYNETQTLDCSYFAGDFDLECDPQPIIADRVDCLINLNDANDYQCWTMIRQEGINGTNPGNYLQVNPSKEEYTQSIFGKKQETRESFAVTAGVGSVYYTDKSIVGDTRYLLAVRCVDEDGNIKLAEQAISPVYDDLNKISARGVWATRNTKNLGALALIGLMAIGLIIFLYIALVERGG